MSLLIPTILPDEFAAAFMGRIGVLNGLKSPGRVQELLHQQAAATKEKNRHPPVVLTLAKLAVKDSSDFVRNHTLVPFYSFIRDSGKCHPYGQPGGLGMLYQHGVRSEQFGPYQCSACIEEDLQLRGFAYWRRSHQVPGITHCMKHLTQLVSNNEATFGQLPRVLERPSNGTNKNFHVEAILVKYAEISAGLLDISSPLPRMHVTRALADRARALGIRAHTTGSRPLVSDLVLEKMPKEWLAKFFPRIARKAKGAFVRPFDFMCNSGSKRMMPISYVLAATALFDTADEALNVLCHVSKDLSLRRKTKSSLPKFDARQRQLHRAFVDCGGNHEKTAIKLGLQELGASNALHAAGLPPLGRTPVNVCRALLSHCNGTPLDVACVEQGVDSSQVVKLLLASARPFILALQEIEKKSNDFGMRTKKGVKSN